MYGFFFASDEDLKKRKIKNTKQCRRKKDGEGIKTVLNSDHGFERGWRKFRNIGIWNYLKLVILIEIF